MDNKNYEKIISQIDLPFSETNDKFLPAIFEILENNFGLKKDSKQSFIDLGSGNGQVMVFSALNYRIKTTGIEIDSNLIKEAKKTIYEFKKKKKFDKKMFRKIKVIHGNFYTHNLKNYDFIYIFSLPNMQKYLKHVFKTTKRGAIIISYKYPLNNVGEFIHLKTKLEHRIENQEVSTYFYQRI
ncbi:MAG: methyltransferase domain-containing protein [Promethearchaeota archaeon]